MILNINIDKNKRNNMVNDLTIGDYVRNNIFLMIRTVKVVILSGQVMFPG